MARRQGQTDNKDFVILGAAGLALWWLLRNKNGTGTPTDPTQPVDPNDPNIPPNPEDPGNGGNEGPGYDNTVILPNGSEYSQFIGGMGHGPVLLSTYTNPHPLLFHQPDCQISFHYKGVGHSLITELVLDGTSCVRHKTHAIPPSLTAVKHTLYLSGNCYGTGISKGNSYFCFVRLLDPGNNNHAFAQIPCGTLVM